MVCDDLLGFAVNTLGVMEKNTVVRLAIQVLSSPFFSFSPSCGKRNVPMVLKTKTQMSAGWWSSICSIFSFYPGTWLMCSFIWSNQSSEASLVNTITGGYQHKINWLGQGHLLAALPQLIVQDSHLLHVLHLLWWLDGGAGLRPPGSKQRKPLLQAT